MPNTIHTDTITQLQSYLTLVKLIQLHITVIPKSSHTDTITQLQSYLTLVTLIQLHSYLNLVKLIHNYSHA